MLPDDPRHGTEAGHEQHCRHGERPCEPCYMAKLIAGRRRNKRKTMGYAYMVDPAPAVERLRIWRSGGASYGDISDLTGVEEGRLWEIFNDGSPRIYTRTANAILNTEGWPVTAKTITRRVRALVRLGWTAPRIAAACNVHHDTIIDIRRREPEFLSRKVKDGILKGYSALSMRIPEASSKQELAGISRARNYAARMNWPAPLAWDDIDDPTEQPRRGTDRRGTDDIDHVVVQRFLDGEYRLRLTRAEKCEVTKRWKGTQYELSKVSGWKPERYIEREDGAA